MKLVVIERPFSRKKETFVEGDLCRRLDQQKHKRFRDSQKVNQNRCHWQAIKKKEYIKWQTS